MQLTEKFSLQLITGAMRLRTNSGSYDFRYRDEQGRPLSWRDSLLLRLRLLGLEGKATQIELDSTITDDVAEMFFRRIYDQGLGAAEVPRETL